MVHELFLELMSSSGLNHCVRTRSGGTAMIGTKQTNIPALIDSSLARGERLLCPADLHLIQRWLIPIRFELSGRLEPAARRKKTAFLRSSVTLPEVQAAIGCRLRAQYDIAQPIPPRLGGLLQELERRSGASIRAC